MNSPVSGTARLPAYAAVGLFTFPRFLTLGNIAVLFRPREGRAISRGMPAYKLFAVHRDLSAEELPLEAYSVRGVK